MDATYPLSRLAAVFVGSKTIEDGTHAVRCHDVISSERPDGPRDEDCGSRSGGRTAGAEALMDDQPHGEISRRGQTDQRAFRPKWTAKKRRNFGPTSTAAGCLIHTRPPFASCMMVDANAMQTIQQVEHHTVRRWMTEERLCEEVAHWRTNLRTCEPREATSCRVT